MATPIASDIVLFIRNEPSPVSVQTQDGRGVPIRDLLRLLDMAEAYLLGYALPSTPAPIAPPQPDSVDETLQNDPVLAATADANAIQSPFIHPLSEPYPYDPFALP